MWQGIIKAHPRSHNESTTFFFFQVSKSIFMSLLNCVFFCFVLCFFFFFFMEALLTEREKKNLVLAVVVTGEHSHHSSWPHAIESSLPDPVYPLVWHNCTFPVVWLLLDLYLALLLQVLSDTEDEESLRRGVFVFSHPCEPVALWRARSNTAADWQSGDHSTSRQNQWWSTLIRLIGSLAPTWKTNRKSGSFFFSFFFFFLLDTSGACTKEIFHTGPCGLQLSVVAFCLRLGTLP